MSHTFRYLMQYLLAQFSLTLHFMPVFAYRHAINRTECCNRVLQDPDDDHQLFPYKLWNELVATNHTIPDLLPPNADNEPWNNMVLKWRSNPGSHEYLDFRCGVQYSSDGSGVSLAAQPIQISLAWCLKTPECNGYEGLKIKQLSLWAGPVVGFLLPAVVFSISVPRGRKLSLPIIVSWLVPVVRNFRILRCLSCRSSDMCRVARIFGPLFKLIAVLVVAIIEMVRWVSVVFTCAGPILAGGLYEMVLDHHRLKQLQRLEKTSPKTPATELRRRRILIKVFLGNVIDGSGSIFQDCENLIVKGTAAQAKGRLDSLLMSRVTFGTAVGSPVAFYVCAYAYALSDAYNKLGDYITSVALQFGLWYSIFILVAMVSGVS